MASDETTDQLLIRRFRGGDEAALRTLFDRYEPRLRARLDPRLPAALRRKISVEDILQEAYLTAYRRIDEFQSERDGGFGMWLEQIASFKLREEVRRYRETAKRGAVEEVSRGARPDTFWFEGRGPSPSEFAMGEELKSGVERAMEALPEDYKTILRLVQIEQLTLRDAGERIGRSREAAKKLYGRALNRLAELLDGDHAGEPK